MSRRSLVTPVIVAVLVTLATGITFSTARSSPVPLTGAARTTPDIPVSGTVVARGLHRGVAADLVEAFPGWRVDVARTRTAGRAAGRDARSNTRPVVVIGLGPEARRWRPYLLRYAADRLPGPTTVVFESLGADRVGDRRRARRTADMLAGDTGSTRR